MEIQNGRTLNVNLFRELCTSVKTGQVIELRKIYFESGKYQLKKASFEQLKILAGYLRNNPNIEIEIAGHTDNIGSDESNKQLSINRANAVLKYLETQGIDKNRINAIGYGETQPLDSNETYEGRQLNRRVAFKITKM